MHLHNDLLRPLVLRCIMMNIKMIQIKKTMTKIIKISHCSCILMRPLTQSYPLSHDVLLFVVVFVPIAFVFVQIVDLTVVFVIVAVVLCCI